MTADGQLTSEERLLRLLQHLGITRAHVVAGNRRDYEGLVATHPETVASLTLVPWEIVPSVLARLASRLLLVGGDHGPGAQARVQSLPALPGARQVVLKDYFHAVWSDVIVDRTDDLDAAIRGFLGEMSREQAPRGISPPASEGEVAGLSYRIQGAGPPLVLLPLALAPSQWEPLLPALSQQCCTITVTGPTLGAAGILEDRGSAAGYLRAVGNMVDVAQLVAGARVLDVGCGTGVLDRWLVRRTAGANRIVAVDINRYLLREAAALARREGLDGAIECREGSAEALPLPENSFDVTLSVTVMEEVDADRMLAELVRVTRPGGRVAVMVRSVDRPGWVNLPLRAELKSRLEAPPGAAGGAGMAERGCADPSLYRRFREAGLTQVQIIPQVAVFDSGPHLRSQQAAVRARLSPEEAQEWDAAVARAEEEGTFFVASTYHCAVGTKP